MWVFEYALLLTVMLPSTGHFSVEAINPPAALNVTYPFAYMQSAFRTGQNGGGLHPITSQAERLAMLRVYASNVTSFRGGEMFINTMETGAALLDVREMNSLILQVSNETNTPPFYGLWIPSRLPGMWWSANYSQQPRSYRAKGLMSNGSEYTYFPTDLHQGTSILNLQGTDLDITDPEAIALAMANLGRVLRANCSPLHACTGPLVGSYLFSEAALSPSYKPFSPDASVGNVSDLQPMVQGQPPLLRMGNPSELYRDDKVVFSFYQGPKRVMPLFSLSARASFVRYCAQRGIVVEHLPADREEFNDDDTALLLPDHVQFLPHSEERIWSLWEEWSLDTWFEYCALTVKTVTAAQKGNPYFRGAFYFQLAGWYAIRNRSRTPVSYAWRDFNGTLQQTTGEIMSDYEYYNDLNPISKGIDLEHFAAAPWLLGFIHEASHGVPHMGIKPPMVMPKETRDRYFLASSRHRHFVNAQGTLASEIMRMEGKLFGVFSRAAYINDPTSSMPSVADTLSPAGFSQAWQFSTKLLAPQVVTSLGAFRFIPMQGEPTPLLMRVFEDTFQDLLQNGSSVDK